MVTVPPVPLAARAAAMTADTTPHGEITLETSRLRLRPWRVSDAAVLRQLWTERDPRVPSHRRIDGHGHPTRVELEDWTRTNQPSVRGLLAIERKTAGDLIGYCGLIDNGRGSPGEPELAFELLRRVWGQGYATEAAWAVVDRARSCGYGRLWATVWDWNTASRRVLTKVGFTEVDRKEGDPAQGSPLSPRDGCE
jgi:RimJ/RimL family protein N-acetyltransferase